MKEKNNSQTIILFFFIAFIGLYGCTFYSYLLFHCVIEWFTISVSWIIFSIAWHSKERQESGYYIIVGEAYLFFGILELLHTLSYKGMGIFIGFDANLPTQLWIAAGYFVSIAFFVATFYIERPINASTIFLLFFIVTILLILSIFGGIFPDCYIENIGLTGFKKISECLICVILFASILKIYLKQKNFSRDVFHMIVFGILFDMFSRMAFIFYVNVYGLSNMLGHYCQLISFCFIYKAFVETGISKPFDLIFHQLVLQKKENEDHIKYFKQLFDNMNEGVAYHQIITDENDQPIDYIFLNINKSFERQTGLTESQLIGKKLSDALPSVYHNQVFDFVRSYGHVALTGQSINFEFFLKELNRWFSISAFCPQKGYFATLVKDISEKKRQEEKLKDSHDELEKRVQDRTKQLNDTYLKLLRTNEDLKDFTYVVSHNLREPLRGIYNLVQLLKNDLNHQTDHDIFNKLSELTRQMENQINSILKYAKISQNEIALKFVDLNHVLNYVIELMSSTINENNVTIVSHPLPMMECNESLVCELYINLISNAIKYNDSENKMIRTGYIQPKTKNSQQNCFNQTCSPIFFVQDNGIGIDDMNYDVIFKLFKRLHKNKEYGGGTGSGLAIVRKIVERHGGWILLHSEVGVGTTFYFML